MSSDNSREVTPSLEMKKLLNQATGQQGFQDRDVFEEFIAKSLR